jgi:hypothetical protein
MRGKSRTKEEKHELFEALEDNGYRDNYFKKA